jgi:S1-C subfamily serine protease
MPRHGSALLTLLIGLPAGLVAQGPDRQGCVTWEEFLARSEGGRVKRPERPAAFYTGLFIRSTIILQQGADILEAVRRSRFLVGSVLCGSPAAAVDLREGDEILTVNEKHAYEPGVLVALQSPGRVGETFRLRVQRGERIMTFTVQSVRRPLKPAGPGV